MNDRRIVTLGVLVVGLLLLAACGGGTTATPAETEVPVVVDTFSVIAEGRVVPVESVTLSFAAGGKVAETLVEEGERVEAGQVLARLEGREQLGAAVVAARLEFASAQKDLNDLLDAAPMMSAQAQLELANARDGLKDSEYRWRVQQEGNRVNGEVLAAEQANLVLAEEEVDDAERAFDKFSGRSKDDPSRALARSNLAAARQYRDSIQRRLNWYLGKPTEIDQAIIDGEVAVAQARMQEAERDWEARQDGPDPSELAVAQARFDNAEAQLAASEKALADLELRAPFAGVVANLAIKAKEMVSPGQAAVILADLSEWIVETDNLTEIEVPKIATGQGATVALDALPDVELSGEVVSISPFFELKLGDVTYMVKVKLARVDPRVKWGMTAVVTFDTPARADVLEPLNTD